jgi:DNA-binding response OmpR family regulator
MRLLVVEDEVKLAQYLHKGLSENGHVVDLAHDGIEGRRLATGGEYDLVLLDLMLPGVDGFGVLAALRAEGKRTPVLMLTARDKVEDRVRGLEQGADDYLVKPFALDEVVARLRALARRYHGETAPQLVAGNLELDTSRQLARCAGRVVPLTAREYALLAALLRSRPRVLSRAALFDRVYGAEARASDKVIEVLMSGLRAKLAGAGWDGRIDNRRGFGYVVA